MSLAKKLLAFLVLAAAIAHAQTWSTSNYATSSQSGATSISATYPSSFSAAVLVALVTLPGDGHFPTSVSGCSATWNLAGSTGAGNGIIAYYAMNATSASCAVTASYSSSESLNLIIIEGTGWASTYALELAVPTPVANCCASTLVVAQQSGDSIVSVTNFGSGSSGCSTYNPPTSFTAIASLTSSSSSGQATGVSFDITGAGSFTLSPSFTCGSGINSSTLNLVFRTALPNPGRLQYGTWTTAASQTFPLPNLSGDLLIAMCGAHGTFSYPTDGAGNTWLALPVTLESDSGNFYSFSFVPSSASYSSNTVTCGGSPVGIAIWEYKGLNTVAPIGGSSVFFTSNPVTSFSSGDVQANSTSVLFSAAAIMGSTATLTPSSGFAPVTFGGNNDSIQQWDEIVSPGSYSNSVTASTGNYFPNAFVLVLESSRVTTPALRQHQRASGASGPDGPQSAVLPSNVSAGDLIIQVVANQSGYSPGTPSDTQGNTYSLIQGGASTQYAIYWAIASTTGSLTVSNSDADCVGAADFSVPSTPVLDQSTSATNASATSLSTGSITTAVSNELLISAGYDISSSYRLYFSSISSGWSGLVFSCGAHNAAAWVAWQPQVAAGTYSDTFGFADPMPLAAAIASFKFPGAGGVPSSGMIISQERSAHPEPEGGSR